MVVIHQTKGGAYVLAEMDSVVSRLWYTTFCIVPYLPRPLESILVASLLAAEDLDKVLVCVDKYPLVDDMVDLVDYLEGEAG